MGNASSSEEGAGGLGHPNLLSKVHVTGINKSDVDAFLTEGRVDNVKIAYITKKQHERFNPRIVNRHVVLQYGNLKLVKQNWATISEQPEAQNPSSGTVTPLVILYDTFFLRLFQLEPSMRGMFEDNMIRQSKFLVGLVNIMVGMEGMLKQGLAPIYSFADRSVTMGVRPEHYEVIAAALPVALEACAGPAAWSKDVSRAWWDVMSFAILVVVERTVESWTSSHGMSLSELWNSLCEWRNQPKRFQPHGKKGADVGVRRMSTLSTVASSMGSNCSNNGPPEAPPPLRQRGPRLESLVAPVRSPTVTPSTGGSTNGGAGGGGSGGGRLAAGDAGTWNSSGTAETVHASPFSSLATGNGVSSAQGLDTARSGASGAWRGKGWGEAAKGDSAAGGAGGGGSRVRTGGDGPLLNDTLSAASPSGELDARNSSCYLSDEPDALSSNNSPTGELQLAGRKARGNGSGEMQLTLGRGSGDLTSGASNGTHGSYRTPPVRTSSRDALPRHNVEPYRIGATGTSAATGTNRSLAAGAGGDKGTSGGGGASLPMDLRSPNRSQSADGQMHIRRGVLATGAGGRDSHVLDGSSREAAAAAGGGAASVGGSGTGGGDRSSLNSSGGGVGAMKVLGSMGLPLATFRRKKITRSASLEEDEELAQRRRRAAASGRNQDASTGGMLRGRGREGSMAMMAGYVRSQSVTDDVLPQRRSGSGGAYETSSEFDLSGEFPSERVRRKGIVSRMRRMGSSVIRFRSGSNKSGTPHGHASHPPQGFGSNSNGHSSSSAGASAQNGSSSVRNGHHHGMDRHGSSRGRADFPNRTSAGQSSSTTTSSNNSRHSSRSNGRTASGRKPAGRANSTGGLETERDRRTLSSRAAASKSSSRAATTDDSSTRRSHSGTGSFASVGSSGSAEFRARAGSDGGHGQSSNNGDRYSSQNGRVNGSSMIRGRSGDDGEGKGSERTGEGGSNGSGSGRGNGGGGDGTEGGGRGGSSGQLTAPTNRWRQMKLDVLMATLEDNPGEDTERNFEHIAEAILYHLGPSEPPTTRALALEVARTFVQRVLSSRSKDKKSSKVRRRAFKELLNQLIPLMLDCLKSPGGSRVSADGTSKPSSNSAKGNGASIIRASSQSSAAGGEGAPTTVGVSEVGLAGAVGVGGEVVVLHYYQQQHHQNLLKVAVLETMHRFLMVLRALFRPPQSTSVQKAVAPLLDAEEEVLRDKAAAVLGKLSLCGKDSLQWVNIAIKVSLEAHNLLHDAWADEGAGQIPSKQVESIMGDHPLLPPLQDTFKPGDAEAHVRAVGRRFPALCKLLATLITAAPPKSHETDVHNGDLQQQKQQQEESAAGTSNQRSLLVALTISLVERVLRMGQQAWDVVDSEGSAEQGTDTSHSVSAAGTLSPSSAAGVSGLLLPPAVTLLEALVASSKLEDAMKDRQEDVCQCMGQAVAQMPVQGGVRYAAYRSMAVVIRYLQPHHAAAGLGVPVLPLLCNEALLALGNRASLHPLNTKRNPSQATGRKQAQPFCFNVRNPANNGHGLAVHENTVWAGVECLAVLVLDCGLYLPRAQIAEIERVVTAGVDLLAHRPLEVSPFNEDEPQMLRHASTREAFVRLAHHYLLLAEGKVRNPGSTLYSEAMLAFHFHLQDPDGVVASECRLALTALKAGGMEQGNGDRPRADRALEDMEAEADNDLSAGGGESGYTLEEGENGEFHVVRRADRSVKKANSPDFSRSAHA